MPDRLAFSLGRAVLVFLYVPILAVIVFSFFDQQRGTVTLEWYGALARDGRLLASLRISAIVAVASATLATLVALLFAIGYVRYRGRFRGSLVALIMIPIIVPEIVVGAALLSVFSSAGVQLGLGTLILGHLAMSLPLAALVLMAATATLDPSLPEAAADLGCGPWQAFRRIYFPMLRPSISAAWLLAFTTSFSNIVISTFLSGVGTTTLPLRIYSSLKTGLTPSINALGALLIIFTLVIVLAVGVRQMRAIVGAGQVK